jgi:hypothetical protein
MKATTQPLVKILSISAILGGLIFSNQGFAHSRYILPSHTSLSGDNAEMVSLDLSVSNDLFHPDRAYRGPALPGQAVNNRRQNTGLASVTITAPDGSTTQAPPVVNLGRKTATYFNLDQNGTYKVTSSTESSIRTIYKKADGTNGRANGSKDDIHLPEGAVNVQSYLSGSRIETFVTRNDTSETALKPTGVGIELGEGTHPNDFFVGEPIELQFLMNGKAVAAGTEILMVRGGTRHRNERGELNLIADQDGRINFTLTEAGFYFLEMTAKQAADEDAAYDYESYYYTATFEVWPE